MFPGVGGLPREYWNKDRNNVAPRIGFVYNLTGDIVLRASMAFSAATPGATGGRTRRSPQTGCFCSTTVISSFDGGVTPFSYLADPFPTGFCQATGNTAGLLTSLGQGNNIVDRNLELPYMQSWNFNIQRKLPGDTVLEVAYSGSRGVHLMGIVECNQLDPQYMPLGTELNRQVPNPF